MDTKQSDAAAASQNSVQEGTPEGSYKAPLIRRTGRQPPPGVDAGFIVKLFPGYTWEKHCANVDKDVKTHAKGPIHLSKYSFYYIVGVDEEFIDSIRREKGVEYVREEGLGSFPEGEFRRGSKSYERLLNISSPRPMRLQSPRPYFSATSFFKFRFVASRMSGGISPLAA